MEVPRRWHPTKKLGLVMPFSLMRYLCRLSLTIYKSGKRVTVNPMSRYNQEVTGKEHFEVLAAMMCEEKAVVFTGDRNGKTRV